MPSIFSSPIAISDHTPVDLANPCTVAVSTSTAPYAGRRSIDPVARRYARDLVGRRYGRDLVAGKCIPPIVAGRR